MAEPLKFCLLGLFSTAANLYRQAPNVCTHDRPLLSLPLNFPGNLSVIKAACNRKKKKFSKNHIFKNKKSLNPNEPFTRLWAPVLIPQGSLMKSETKTWQQSDKEKCQAKVWVYLILMFSNPPWVGREGGKNTEKPPLPAAKPTCSAMLFCHLDFSFPQY